jgi:hypothetical protein
MDDHDERIQRALNEAKKRELEEKHGAAFSSEDAALPPDAEAEWLRQIEEFELKYEAAERTTVREFIGNPEVRLPGVVPPDKVKEELERLLALLEEKSVVVHFDVEITDAEAYRFLVEKLLPHETDDIRIEGMTHNFIYSEFFPEDGE